MPKSPIPPEIEFNPDPRDPAVMALPHPKRLDVANFAAQYQGPHYSGWRKWLQEPNLPVDQVISLLAADRNASVDDGSFMALITWLRYKAQHGRLFQTRDDLEQLLLHTDVIGAGTPARYLTLPYQSIFLEFGENRNSPYRLYHPLSGEHIAEGAYLQQGLFYAQPDNIPASYTGLLEAGRAYRVIDIVFTGSPVGKMDFTDDVTFKVSLYIGSDDETIDTVLERDLAAMTNEGGSADPLVHDAARQQLLDMIAHVVKILLYLNSTTVRTIPVPDEAALLKRMAGTPPVLRKKLVKKLETTYDRIVIGPEKDESQPDAANPTGREMHAHWRRGHFRHQAYGEQYSLHRVILIKPVLVRADRIGDLPPPDKDYIVH